MNKLTIFLCLICIGLLPLLSACTTDNKNQVIRYQRKFVKPNKQVEQPKSDNIIDLSDGKRIDFSAPIGAQF